MYIYINMYIGTISFVILLMFLLPYRYSMVYSINYTLYGRTMGTVLPLLLLLIVIYNGVGMYNETIIMDWYVVYDDDDDVGLCQSTC